MWLSPFKRCLLCLAQNSFIFLQKHFFRTLKPWICKINGLEIFLLHSSQKYFLNLLLQENTPKPIQNRKQTKTNQNKQEKFLKFFMQVFWRKDWNSGIWIFRGDRDSNFTWKQGCKTILWRHLFVQSGGLDRQAQGWSLEKWDQPELQPPMDQGHPSTCSSPNSSFANQPAKSGFITKWHLTKSQGGLGTPAWSSQHSYPAWITQKRAPWGLWWSQRREGITPIFICQGKLPLFFFFRAKPPPDVLRWARALETIGCTSGRR